MDTSIQARLEYLRGELRAERISYGELAELQGLAEHIDPGDVELLEAAGVPEFPDDTDDREPHYYNVNEEGLVYDEHDSIGAALTVLHEFPNDTIVVTVGPWRGAERA